MRALLTLLVSAVAFLSIASTSDATIRVATQYDWYPQSAVGTHWHPNLIKDSAGNPVWPYDSGSTQVIDKQIKAQQYGLIQADAHSWWGQGHYTDQRFPTWLSESDRLGTGFKNAIYYEAEGNTISNETGSPNPPVSQIVADLDYMASNGYFSDPAYLHLKGRPVVFVYGDGSDSCGMVDRWTQAKSQAKVTPYIVLKVFNGYLTCANSGQVDSWHQYGPGVREDTQGNFSKSISAGFWKYNDSATSNNPANHSVPFLARGETVTSDYIIGGGGTTRSCTANGAANCWAEAVQHLAAYKGDFQFLYNNEWGEGSALESSTDWDTASGYGKYIARLRVQGQAFGSAVPDKCHDGLDNDFNGVQDAADPNECATPTPTPTPSPTPSPSPTPTPTPSPTPTPTPTGGPNATTPCLGTATPVGGYKHIVWLWEENEAQSSITTSNMPYLTGLAAKCGKTTNYKAITHPSLPNYIAATSGGTQGVTDDNPPSSHPLSANSIFGQLGTNWTGLEDGMQSNCALVNGGTSYAVKHNPAAYYTAIRTACASRDIPYNSGQTPDISKAFTFITPNLCNDAHDCSVTTADNWLKVVIPKILNSATYAAGNTLLVITFDEGVSTNQTVYTAVIAPSVVKGTVSASAFNHYSLLGTTERLLGLPKLGSAASAADMGSAFHLG